MSRLQILLLIFAVTVLCYSASSQPVIEVFLSLQTPESRGAQFSTIEELHEVLVPDSGKPQTFRVVKKYNSAGKIFSMIKYNSAGGVQCETTWAYSGSSKPLKKSIRQFINYKGWVTEEVRFVYNDTTGHLQDILFFYEKIKKKSAQVLFDSLGRIREVNVFNEAGAFVNIERFMYVPANNSLRIAVLSQTEQFIAAYVYPLDRTKEPPKSAIYKEYYPNGDIMLEALPDAKLGQGYYYEYIFDSYGNWTEKQTYQCAIGSNNKIRKKKLEYKITRKISY